MYVGSRLKRAWKSGRRHLKSLPSSRTGENPPYGMIGGVEETSASFEARSAPRSYPTVLRTTHEDRTRRSDRCLCVRRCRSRALRVFEAMKSISADCKWRSIAGEGRGSTRKQPGGQISV